MARKKKKLFITSGGTRRVLPFKFKKARKSLSNKHPSSVSADG